MEYLTGVCVVCDASAEKSGECVLLSCYCSVRRSILTSFAPWEITWPLLTQSEVIAYIPPGPSRYWTESPIGSWGCPDMNGLACCCCGDGTCCWGIGDCWPIACWGFGTIGWEWIVGGWGGAEGSIEPDGTPTAGVAIALFAPSPPPVMTTLAFWSSWTRSDWGKKQSKKKMMSEQFSLVFVNNSNPFLDSLTAFLSYPTLKQRNVPNSGMSAAHTCSICLLYSTCKWI